LEKIMRVSFTFGADRREMQGKGASRRLRHSGKVPAILYGGPSGPQPLVLDQQNLLTMIGSEKFYSSIVRVNVDGKPQEAIIKDVQMHPARHSVVHVDLQRVVENEAIRLRLPIHFKGEAAAPGVKSQGGLVSHMRADVEVTCLPKHLPEFLEIDLSGMNLNETLFLSDIPLPPGVLIPELGHGRNAPVVSIHSPRAAEPEPVAVEAAAVAAVPAEGAPAPAGPAGAAPAAPEGKKEEKKDAAPAKKDAAPAKKDAAPVKKEGGKK
jgi:large subunit ribosomal protein L25